MESKVFVLLALVAATQAGPIAETITAVETCAQRCTDTSKFTYAPGTTYEFQYDNEIRTAVHGASEDHAGIQLSATVHMEFISKCEVTMRLSDVILKEHDPEQKTMIRAPETFNLALERNPIRVAYQDGAVEELCLSGEEPRWVLNIKRGILSVFQNKMDDLTSEQTVNEVDVSGDCETHYTSENGWSGVTVKKSKNLLGCMDRNGYQSIVKGTQYRVPSAIQSMPLMKSNHSCEQSISSSGRLNLATCQETHTFRPFSRGDSGATTKNTQTLKFVSERAGVSRAATINRRVPMKFEHDQDVDMSLRSRKDLETKLMEVCTQTASGVRPDTPSLFSSLVYVMKNMAADNMNTVFQTIEAGTFCPDNKDRVKKFFLDALPMVGTSDALRLMTQLITTKVVSDAEAQMWLTTLAFIQKPTAQMIAEVKPLLSITENQEKAMLGVSSLVNSYCRENEDCLRLTAVQKVISVLQSNLGTSCKVTSDNMQTILYSLRAIGNAGYAASSAIPILAKCFNNNGNAIEVRLSAIDAFHKMPCSADKNTVMQTFLNQNEDSEVRIAAYRALMRCPDKTIISSVKSALESEEVNQVGSYVWSHLTNLMETSDPHKQEIRAILEDSVLQKEFDMDKRKYSRNYEGSLFLERINTGAKAEGDLIWSSKSFIPRSAMVNLTVDLFGESMNLFEIGGRAEGLEYFLESYFGPNGYFSENDVQAAADETALKTIKGDKVGRMDKRFESAIDDLRGNLYLRVFGNEIRYMNFQGLESLLSSNINILEMLIKLSQNNEYTYSHSSMFIDSRMIIPTSSGFPLNLTINGTATVDLKASGKIDLLQLSQSPSSLDINGKIQPSAAVEISSMMSVDAFVTKSGVKMVSTMHSSSVIQGHLQMTGGKVLSAQWDLPEDKMEVFSVKSAFFTIHREAVREQNMVTDNRQSHSICTGSKMATITGLELCGELSFPNASLVSEAPYFPMTGPVNMAVILHKRDTLTGYKFEAKSSHTANANHIRLAFTTPESRVDRDMVINMELDKTDGSLDMTLSTPWKKAAFTGTLTKNAGAMQVGGKVVYEGSVLYMINAQVLSKKSGPGVLYTPSLEIQRYNGGPVDIKGTLMFAPMRQIEADFTLSGLTSNPLSVKATLMNKPAMRRLAFTYSADQKKEYSFESYLQTVAYKLKTAYKPILSIRTPTAEIVAFGGGVTYAPGKGFDVDLLLDKVLTKPMKLKGKLAMREFKKKNRKIFNTRMDFSSSMVDLRLQSKIDNRNWKTMATDIDITYNVKRVARDNIKLVSKISNLSTKSLTKARGSLSFEMKRNPHMNAKVVGNVNHNFKHSEFDVDIRYGENMKDENKHIEVEAMINKNIKSLTFASLDFNTKLRYPGKDLNIVAKGSHKHTKRTLVSSLQTRLNKNVMETSLKIDDQSKDMTNISGELGISYNSRSMKIIQTAIKPDPTRMTTSTTVQIGRNTKHLIVSSWSRPSPLSLSLSTNVNLQNEKPIRIAGDYNFDMADFKILGSLEHGRQRYASSIRAANQMWESLEINAEMECPTRRVVASYGVRKQMDTVSSNAELKWNADRDDTQILSMSGSATFVSSSNMNGSLSIQYPGRTLALNMAHLANSKYISHVDFTWEPTQTISFDTTLSGHLRPDDVSAIGKIQMTTPFASLRSMDVNMAYSENRKAYTTNMDATWNPSERISSTVVIRKPVSLTDIYATLVAKTPFPEVKLLNAEFTHKFGSSLSTVGKITLNKKSITAEIAFANKGTTTERNINGHIDIKSTIPGMKKLIIAASHKGDFNTMETSASIQHNRNTYAVNSEMSQSINAGTIESTGKIVITGLSTDIQTLWNHRFALNEFSSSSTATWGRNAALFKVAGHHNMGIQQGSASSTLEIQTPFEPLRDVVFDFSHEHRQGNIQSSIGMRTDGKNIGQTQLNYVRQNGRVESVVKLSSPYCEDLHLEINSEYANMPKSGLAKLMKGGDVIISLDGTVTDGKRSGMVGTIEFASPTFNITSLKLVGKTSRKENEMVNEASLAYDNDDVVSIETRHRVDAIKQLAVAIRSPFYEPITGEVRIQGPWQAFTTNAYIEAPVLNKWELSSSWDTLNGLAATLRIDTPFNHVRYLQASAESRMAGDARESSFSVEYMPDQIVRLDSVYNFKTMSNAQSSIKLTTPFEKVPYAAIAFNQRMDSQDFSNHIELEYQQGQKIEADTSFSTQNGIETTFNIKSPFAGYETISASTSYIGSLKQFTSFARASCSDKTYSVNAQFTSTPKITGELSIKTPHDGVRTVRSVVEFDGTLTDFTTQATVTVEKRSIAGELTLSLLPSFIIKASVESPTKLIPTMKGGISFEGPIRNFTAHAEAIHETYGKYVAVASLDSRSNINGEVSVKTPISGYRSMRAVISHAVGEGSCSSMLEMSNGNERYSGEMKFEFVPMSMELTLRSPMKAYQMVRMSLNFAGQLLRFKSHGEFQLNKLLSIADLSVNVLKKKDIDFSVKSPYMYPLKASFDHFGSFKKFNTKAAVRYGKQKYNAVAKFQSKPSISAAITIKTPLKVIKGLSVTAKHTGDINNFRTSLQTKLNGKSLTAEGSFVNNETAVATVTMKSSYLKPINMKVIHAGTVHKFSTSSEASYGTNAATMDVSLDITRGVMGTASMTTPFNALQNINVALSHTGLPTNFKTHGAVNYNKRKCQVDVTVDTTSDVQAAITITTPFTGFEDIVASLSHAGTLLNFNTDSRFTVNGQKTEGTLSFINDNSLSGSMTLSSSHRSIKDMSASFSHTGSLTGFNSHAELIVEQDRSEANAHISTTSGFEGSLSLRTPMSDDFSTGFEFTNTSTSRNARVYTSYGPTQLEVIADLNRGQITDGLLRINTPFQGFESSGVSFRTEGTVTNFKSHAEMMFMSKRHQTEVSFSMQSGLEGSFKIKSPAFKTTEGTLSVVGSFTNFQSKVDVLYGKVSQAMTQGSVNLENGINIDMIFKSQYTRNLKVYATHQGQVTDFRNQFGLVYGGAKSEAESHFRMTPSVAGGITITLPIIQEIRATFDHSGPVTNCQTMAEISYGGISQLSFNGRSNIEMPIDMEFRIKTPVVGCRNMHALFKLSADDSVALLTELAVEDNKVNLDGTFSLAEGRAILRTPYTEDLSGQYDYTGEPTNFQSHMKMQYGSRKVVDVDFGLALNAPLSGMLIVKLPVPGYEMTKIAFSESETSTASTGRGEIKFGDDHVELSLDISTGSSKKLGLTLKSSRTQDVTFVVGVDNGVNGQYQFNTEIAYGPMSNAAEASLTIGRSTTGRLTVRPYSYQPIIAEFTLDGKLPNIRSNAKLVANGQKQLDSTMTFAMTNGIEGQINIESPLFSQIGAGINVKGTPLNFVASADVSYDGEQTDIKTTFRMADSIEGRVILASPMIEPVSFGFEVEGRPMHFQSKADMSTGEKKVEIEATLNVETALTGSFTLRSPMTEDIQARFEHTGPWTNCRSTGSIQYGDIKELSVLANFQAAPLEGVISLKTPIPGYESLSAAVKQDGAVWSFTNHFEVSIGTDKTEVDLSFDASSTLGGQLSIRSPYIQDVNVQANFVGTISNFRSTSGASYGPASYSMITTFEVALVVVATMEISTPYDEFKQMEATFKYGSPSENALNAMAKITKNKQSLIEGNVDVSKNMESLVGSITIESVFFPTVKGKIVTEMKRAIGKGNLELAYGSDSVSLETEVDLSSGIDGTVSLTNPFTSDMKAILKFSNEPGRIAAQSQVSYGEKEVSVAANFASAETITSSISIKTPFSGFEEMAGNMRVVRRTNQYLSHFDVGIAEKKVEVDTMLRYGSSKTGSITVLTPFAGWERSEVTASMSGNLQNLRSMASFEKSGDKYEVTTQISLSRPLSGELTIATPIQSFEKFTVTFNSVGEDIKDMQVSSKVILPSGVEYSGVFENQLSGNTLMTKVELKSQGITYFVFDIQHAGIPQSFNTKVSVDITDIFSMSSATTLRAIESLDFSSTISTTLFGKTDIQKLSIQHDGHWTNFRNSANMGFMENEYSIGSSFKYGNKILGSASLNFPFENFKDIALSFEHGGNINRFTTRTEFQYALNKRIRGIAAFSRSGFINMQASLTVTTPFEGLKMNKLAYRHTGSSTGFECNADMTMMDQSVIGNLKVDAAPLSASITLITPFAGFEQIGGDFKVDMGQGFFNTEANVAFMQGKRISIRSNGNIQTSPATAVFTIKTPFQGYENSEVSWTYSGNMKAFQSGLSVSTPFMGNMRGDVSLRNGGIFDTEFSAKFNSQIQNLETLNFVLITGEKIGKYSGHAEASWTPSNSIVLDGAVTMVRNSMREEIMITTPFEGFRSFKVDSERRWSDDKFEESFVMEHNDDTLVDYDFELTLLDRKSGSIVVRAPRPIKIEMGGCIEYAKLEADIYVNWNTDDALSNIRFEGLYENKNNNPISLKVTSPMQSFGMNGAFEKTSSRLESHADFFWNEMKVGYNTELSANDIRLKAILPSRSLEWSGSQSSRTIEGMFIWDADRDETKKIGFRSAIVPSDDAVKADLSIMMPSIGKDVQFDSEMILNRGRIIFEGKTDFTYSTDSRKKLSITSRLEDKSTSANAKNYSFSLGLSHPFTSIGVKLDSHIGESRDRLSAGVGVEYLTVRRQTKTFNVNGDVNKLRRSMSLNVDTPVKKISINGDAQLASPFRFSLVNKYDNSRPLRTVLSVSPVKRLIDFSMSYDIDNPESEIHITAKYVNSSAVQAKVFRKVNNEEIQDGVLAVRLNNSHLLHSRLHWRPSMIAELREYGMAKVSGFSKRMENTIALMKESVEDEMLQKLNKIQTELLEETRPLVIELEKDMEVLVQMYAANEYHMRDVVDVIVVATEKASQEMMKSSAKVKETMSNAITEAEHTVGMYMDTSNQMMTIASEMMMQEIEGMMIEYNRIYVLYYERMYNMTQHPDVVSMQNKLNHYMDKIKSFPIKDHLAGVSDMYTSAIYNAHARMMDRLSVLSEMKSLQTAKEAANVVLQHGGNAYKYWEIRENMELAAMTVFEWIKSEFLAEVSDVREAIMNFEKSSITVWDPEHGEIQTDVYLPLPVQTLDTLPTYDVNSYARRVQSYVPDMKFDMPSTDVSNWIPPFEATATIQGGRHVTTFDGLTYDLEGRCTYMLAKDFVDKNFSISYTASKNQTLSIFFDGNALEINTNGEVKVNGDSITLPATLKNVMVTSLDGITKVDGAGSFAVTYDSTQDVYTVTLNGWYFGKTGGLLGSYDNEPSNDMITSYGRRIDTANRFARTWDIGVERCI